MRNLKLDISTEAEEYVRKAGITREYGAREVDRVISGEVKPLLAELLLFGELKQGGSCRLELESGRPAIGKVAKIAHGDLEKQGPARVHAGGHD